MSPRFITGKKPPSGHYSSGVLANNFLFVSGQLPINPDTGEISLGSISEQVMYCLSGVEEVLKLAGGTKFNIVNITVYIDDINHWNKVNDSFKSFFGNHKPARCIVPTEKLHHNASIEIEAIAYIESLDDTESKLC